MGSPTPAPLTRLTPPLREGSDMLGKVLFLFVSYYLLFIVCYLIFLFNISLPPPLHLKTQDPQPPKSFYSPLPLDLWSLVRARTARGLATLAASGWGFQGILLPSIRGGVSRVSGEGVGLSRHSTPLPRSTFGRLPEQEGEGLAANGGAGVGLYFFRL